MSWLFLLGTILFILPLFVIIPIKKVGYKGKIPRGKAIFTLNHYSSIDPIFMCIAFPFRMIHFLGKSELFKNKIIAFFGRGFGAIPVERGKGDLGAIKKVVAVLNRNKTIGIFPEGTRNKEHSTEMAEFKNGVSMFALKTGAIIVPMFQLRKVRVFRWNYIYIGEPFDLSSIEGDRLNKERLALATQLLTEHMNRARDGMLEYAEQKGLKYIK